MRIYVGNLSFGTTEHELQDRFAEFGDVEQVNIITDRETGRSRGFAFVTMADDNAGREAIEQVNGTDMGGRTLTVNEARPRTQNRGGYGGGGGGGRSRGGW